MAMMKISASFPHEMNASTHKIHNQQRFQYVRKANAHTVHANSIHCHHNYLN